MQMLSVFKDNKAKQTNKHQTLHLKAGKWIQTKKADLKKE